MHNNLKISLFFFDFIHYHIARCKAFLELLKQTGYDLKLYSLREKSPALPIIGLQELLEGKIEILSNSRYSLNSIYMTLPLLRALNRDNPDAVIIPGYRTLPCYAALAWCKAKSRVAVLLSESQKQDYPRARWREALKRPLIKLFDAALVGGTTQYEYAKELGLSPEVIFTGYDVVDNQFWEKQAEAVRQNRDECLRRLGLPPEFFLASCRFIPKKNLDGLITAYTRYLSKAGKAPWHLVICGNGPLDPQIRGMVDKFRLRDKVHLPGYQDFEKMATFYGLASAFVHASSYAEQWGLVVNEAMAAGLPVLVSKICGCAHDLVHEGVNGFKFDPYDTEGIARLMQKISSGELDLEAMGHASRRIIARWSPEIFAQNLLKSIAAAKASRPAQRLGH